MEFSMLVSFSFSSGKCLLGFSFSSVMEFHSHSDFSFSL